MKKIYGHGTRQFQKNQDTGTIGIQPKISIFICYIYNMHKQAKLVKTNTNST